MVQTGNMKNLPGLRPLLFCVLVLTVALGVFAGDKEKLSASKKHTKYLVKFGWDEDNNLDPVDHSVAEITAKLDNDAKRYKLRHYDDGNPGPDQGDLNDVCLPTSSSAAAALSGSVLPAASPSATVGGSKTQTVGIASFTNSDKASAFATFVNSTPTPTPKSKAKAKPKAK
jgi:hypothetical protein